MESIYKNPVIVTTHKLILPGWKADIGFPVVTGLQDPAQTAINREILTLVYKLMAIQASQLSQQGYTNPDVSITGWYEVKTNERGVLSLTVGNYTIAIPAANGRTIVKALTFDTETGKSYSLGELFKPGSDYVKKLSDIIKVQIRERGIQLIAPFDSIKPDQDYYISDKVLVIFFQETEITPHYYGPPMFPISVYEIQDIIREGSPLDRVTAG